MTETNEPVIPDQPPRVGDYSAPTMRRMNQRHDRYLQNTDRILSLLQMHGAVHATHLLKDSPSLAHADDLLRSAVVFLHANLEDFLRDVARAYLPEASVQALTKIPLAGSMAGRAEKFTLAELARHRGKTVLEVVRESVDEHLERTTFNNTGDIAQLLQALNVNSELATEQFPQLDAMMRRRHQIVHRADHSRSNSEAFDAINHALVLDWWQACGRFVAGVLAKIATQDEARLVANENA